MASRLVRMCFGKAAKAIPPGRACQTAGRSGAHTAKSFNIRLQVAETMHTPEPRRPSGVHPRVPVLVLGKGVTALGAVRALGRRGTPLFVAGNPGSLVTGSRWYRRLPAEFLDDPSRIDAALEALDVPRLVLLPCSDAWAIAVSRLRPDLQTRFPASVSSPDIVRRFTDKGRFAEMVVKLGIPHPRTILLLEPGALDGVPDDAFETSFLKPVNSGSFAAQYGVKAVRPKNREQARTFLAGALEKGLPLMLQEFIPGPPTLHVFVEGFIDRKGRVCGMLARRRLRMFPPDFGNSTFTESIPLDQVRGAEESLLRLLSGIGYRGVFSAEFKLDTRDGVFKILEVNARPWWFVNFTAECGVDVCDMARRDALGEDIEPVTTYAIGRRCFHLRRDLQSRRAATENGRLGLVPLVRSWVGAEQLTFAWDDPRPGVRDFLNWSRPKIRRRIGR